MTKKVLAKAFMYFTMIFVIIVSIFPILWVIMSSFKTNAAILSSPFSLPEAISFEVYFYLFENYEFARYALNSVLVSIPPTITALICFSLAGYVMGKYQFPGRNILFTLFIITMLVPAQAKAQPVFALVSNLGLFDNIVGVALVYLSNGLAISLFILRTTFASIPKELDEAARIDGAGFFRTFALINFPLAKTGLSTAGILMFLGNWNEYYYAALLITSNANRTLPTSLQFFNMTFSFDYSTMFAALAVVVLPGIIIYAIAQEQVQASVASSGIKG